MLTSDFDFNLPEGLIAQQPSPARDQSRLLVLDRKSKAVSHEHFRDIPEHFQKGDLLVLNDTRVIPARLHGVNDQTGGEFEILLLEEAARNDWWAMMRPGKRARLGTRITLRTPERSATSINAIVIDKNDEGHRRLRFEGAENILNELEKIGETPLPPYIRRSQVLDADRERYQTVFSRLAGSVAAPTAGLHFTETILNEIRERGVEIVFVTLHVGFGTFAPVKAKTITEHVMHEERFEVSPATAKAINSAKSDGRRVIAVGTTTLRVLEAVGARNNAIIPGAGKTKIFIYPPYEFKIVDALLTNFHLPCSTLLMLVSAFASPGGPTGRELVLSTYAEAIRECYRFFSYGDAMLIV